jgi:hypothetical protein
MKTAMQEAIALVKKYENRLIPMGVLSYNLELLLEKEKEQIIQAYQLGAINNYDKAKWVNLTPEYFEICGKEYYTKNYNQNK